MVEGINFHHRLIKSFPSRALVLRLNLIFLATFVAIYTTLLLRPPLPLNATSTIRCSFRECHLHHNKEKINTVRAKAVLEEDQTISSQFQIPRFLKTKKNTIAMVNTGEEAVQRWNKELSSSLAVTVKYEKVSQMFKWEDLFPEWIDEEEESEVPSCPEIPMPEFEKYIGATAVVGRLPSCGGSARDVGRLQVHLVAAGVAARSGVKAVKVALWSECRPMMEIFRCSDLVAREGNWWVFEPDVSRLVQKLALPVGSCQLALPLWGQGIHEVYEESKIPTSVGTKKEAYATVLHSSESYVCGAIALAQSLRKTGTMRDLILLHDASISRHNLAGLSAAGWTLRLITRIRNPKAEKGTYNEYNYSKLRLWQLTEYDKIVFVDADAVALRPLDVLFRFPEISAVGNDFSLFNSGVMVVEPSNCTFDALMERIHDVVSYNGGDQGFLNQVFVWWHRLPRRVNFLKNFWENSTSTEMGYKNELFGAEPAKVFTIHYLGWKPWMCYRDYDCNFDKEESLVYASDVAHRRWWTLHDSMDHNLQSHCRLTKRRRIELDWDRGKATKMALENGRWRINVTDPRRHRLVD